MLVMTEQVHLPLGFVLTKQPLFHLCFALFLQSLKVFVVEEPHQVHQQQVQQQQVHQQQVLQQVQPQPRMDVEEEDLKETGCKHPSIFVDGFNWLWQSVTYLLSFVDTWSADAIRGLTAEYIARKDRFTNSALPKISLFKDVADTLHKKWPPLKGRGEVVQRKWRRLKKQ